MRPEVAQHQIESFIAVLIWMKYSRASLRGTGGTGILPVRKACEFLRFILISSVFYPSENRYSDRIATYWIETSLSSGKSSEGWDWV